MPKQNPGSAAALRIDLPTLIDLRRQATAPPAPGQRVSAARDGGYRSALRGRGMEFAEVRSYQAGDDVRTIDWRVTARTGKPHTKLFHEERERPVLIAIDYRRPMFFATRGRLKAVQASHLAALLAWQCLEQGDRLGAFLFSEEQHIELRPQSGKRGVLSLLRQMVADPAWDRPAHQPFQPQQRLFQTLLRLQRVVRPGSSVTLISDFAQWDENVEKQLSLIARHNSLSLLFCYDPLEQQLPTAGLYPVSDGQRSWLFNSADPSFCHAYQQQFSAHRQRIEHFCRRIGARYADCLTNDAPAACLQRLLNNKDR